jgi:sulfite exporter TauE/SafE
MSFTLALSAVTLGLLSAPHCATMCGPIVAASQVGRGKRRLLVIEASSPESIVVAQNAGRIASYALAGVAAGGMGAIVGRGTLTSARDALQLVAAFVLVFAGLALTGVVPARARLESIGRPLWRRLQPVARRLLPIDTWPRAALFGAIWGFLPCGLVYSALSLAMVSGSLLEGAATMLAFGVGTVPAVASMGALAGAATGAFGALVKKAAVRRAAGALIVVFGVFELGVALHAIETRGDAACCHAHAMTSR